MNQILAEKQPAQYEIFKHDPAWVVQQSRMVQLDPYEKDPDLYNKAGFPEN